MQAEPDTSAAAPAAPAPAAPKTDAAEPQLQPFKPLVKAAKKLLGEKSLNEVRGKVIATHSTVIKDFVDTHETKFGQFALRALFSMADKDNNGSLDRAEVVDALNALGFTYLSDKQIDGIIERGDADENDVIDWEEFQAEAPRTLKANLIKLAKKNGHDLGFLA